MHALALLFTTSTFSNIAWSLAQNYQEAPFENVSPRENHIDGLRYVFQKRQGTCSNGFVQCTAVNSAVCCPSTAVCTRDPSGNAACCPSGYVCTGGISGSPGITTSTSSSSPYVLGGTTTTTATNGGTTTIPPGYSIVPNAYYPFIQIPSTYPNSQSCLSAFTLCSSASQACFSSLVGQNGVTVSGVDTQGVTQSGNAGMAATGASSICSSLSSKGCFNLQSSQCNSFGSAGATGTQGLVQSGAAAPAVVARCTGAVYTAAAAAAVAGVGLARFGGV